MALRLAGESVLSLRGADNQGWVREIRPQDALPGLIINQQGTGRIFDFQDNGVSKVYLPDGGNLSLASNLAFQQASAITTSAGDLTLTPAGEVVTGKNFRLNASSPILYIKSNYIAVESTDWNFRIADSGDGSVLRIRGSGGVERACFTTAGNVGIGATNPGQKLEVAGNLLFSAAASILTTSGDLSLNPAGKVALASGKLITGWSTQTTVGAAGGASALPATPTGYAKIDVGGTNYVIPYYAAA